MAEAESKKPVDLGEKLGQAGTTVKDGIVGSLKGLGEIEGQMVTVARNTVGHALQATGSAAGAGFFSNRRLTVSERHAPFLVHSAMRSCFRTTCAGLVTGLYCPTTSRLRPSRARSFSITTMR